VGVLSNFTDVNSRTLGMPFNNQGTQN